MKKRVKLEYTGLIIVFLIIGGIFFFMNDLDLEITGNAFLNISTYSSSNLSSFPTGTLSNVSVFGDGSVKLSFNPTRVGSLTDAPGGDNGWLNAARKIFVLGNFAHVTAQINDSISLIDITNKSFPTINGSNYSLWLDGAVGVFALGNYTYVVSNNNDSFNIINTTNKSAPVINSSLIDIGAETNGWTNGAWGVFVSGDYAFITARQNDSMSIINITNKSAPVINGSFNSSWLDGAEEIFVSGDYAYIASNLNDSITVINITNYTQSGVPESNPVKVSHLTSGWLEGAAGIHISGDFAYVTADINDSISIIDISNKSNITLLGSLTSGWLDGA